MAWERLAFAGFDTQGRSEFIVLNFASIQPIASDAKSRTGGYALEMFGGALAAILLKSPSARVRTAFAFNHSSTSTTGGTRRVRVIGLRSGVVGAINLAYDGVEDILYLRVNGVDVDSVSGAVAGFSEVNTWHDIGMQANVLDSVEGFVSVYVDGIKILEYTGPITGGPVTHVYLGGMIIGSSSWALYAYLDDFYLDGTEDIEPDIAPANLRFDYRDVTADGASAQWTPVGVANNWDAVNDGVPDGDATYVASAVNGQRDLYVFGGYDALPGYDIEAVIPVHIARNMAAGSPMKIRPVIFDGVTVQVFEERLLGAGYDFHWQRLPVKPSGEAWGNEVVAAASIGQDSSVPA